MDLVTKQKWDHAAAAFDLMSAGPEKRWAPRKRELFSKMHGKVLFLAVGTGLDIQFFPYGQDITGIDIITKMLEKAQPRAAQCGPALAVEVLPVRGGDLLLQG